MLNFKSLMGKKIGIIYEYYFFQFLTIAPPFKFFHIHYKYWHDFTEKNLFGIEISEQIVRTAKMNMIIHDDSQSNIISLDGVKPSDQIRKESDWLSSEERNRCFKSDDFFKHRSLPVPRDGR